MPITSRTRHEFPRDHPKAKPMFSKGESGEYPHRKLLSYAMENDNKLKPKRGVTKTLSR
jgi:hypothetical protein